ncbi:hypothetical protein GPALN_004065 [Globodera pallida]|nr:hypothetical protein GPALN_004065 [Globodera pallida]
MNFATQFLIFVAIIALVAQSVLGGCLWSSDSAPTSPASSDGPYGKTKKILKNGPQPAIELWVKAANNSWTKKHARASSSSKSTTTALSASAAVKRRRTN